MRSFGAPAIPWPGNVGKFPRRAEAPRHNAGDEVNAMEKVLQVSFPVVLSALFCWCAANPQAGAQAPQKEKVILDTDIGGDIDDAYALSLALSSPELEVLGVCVNTGAVEQRAKIALKMLHEAGRDDIPVAVGLPGPRKDKRPNQYPYAQDYEATKPIDENAVEFLARMLNNSNGDITVIAYGPLSNIAALVEKHPMAAKRMKRLIIMGGMCGVGALAGREVFPEYNVRCDVPASQTVFRAGLPLTMITLDVTLLCKLTKPYQQRFEKSQRPLAQAMVKLLDLWPGKIPTLHDPLAVVYSYAPQFIEVKPYHVVVDDQGRTIIVQGKEPNCNVSVTVQAEKFLDFFCDRVAGPN